MLALALWWDTFPIPLRYFTNTAAHALLMESAPELFAEMDYDLYLKHIRGTRSSSLGLQPSADTVVSLSRKGPGEFKVNATSAKRVGLAFREFNLPAIPGRAAVQFKLT